MLGASAMAHMALVAAFVLVPAWWFGAEVEATRDDHADQPRRTDRPERRRPDDAGRPHHPAGRPVEPKKPVEPVRPPSAKTPEMVEPTKAPPRKTTPNQVEAKDPRARADEGRGDPEGYEHRGNRRQGHGIRALVRWRRRPGRAGDRRTSAAPNISTVMATSIKSNWNNQQGAPDARIAFRHPEGRPHCRHHRRRVERRRNIGFVREARVDPDASCRRCRPAIQSRRSRCTCILNISAEKRDDHYSLHRKLLAAAILAASAVVAAQQPAPPQPRRRRNSRAPSASRSPAMPAHRRDARFPT